MMNFYKSIYLYKRIYTFFLKRTDGTTCIICESLSNAFQYSVSRIESKIMEQTESTKNIQRIQK